MSLFSFSKKKIPLKHVIERRLYPQVGSGEFLLNLDSWYVQGLCKNFFANLVAKNSVIKCYTEHSWPFNAKKHGISFEWGVLVTSKGSLSWRFRKV